MNTQVQRPNFQRFENPVDPKVFALNCQEVAEDIRDLRTTFEHLYHASFRSDANNLHIANSGLMFLKIIDGWAEQMEEAAQEAIEGTRNTEGRRGTCRE